MVEAGGWGPGRQSFAAQVAEALLEGGDFGAGLRVATRNGAAGARVAALEVDFADAEAHHAAFAFAVELIFPERGQVSVGTRSLLGNFGATDFERGAKTLARAVERQAGEPVADGSQRRGGNNRGAAGDRVVGEPFARVAHQDLLLEIDAEPCCGVFSSAGEGKRARGNIAAIARNREGDGAEIRRVGGADQVHRSSAFAIDPAAVDRKERPSPVVFESAARSDTRLVHRHRIERLDRMQADARQPRQEGVSLHAKIVAQVTPVERSTVNGACAQLELCRRQPVRRKYAPTRERTPSATARIVCTMRNTTLPSRWLMMCAVSWTMMWPKASVVNSTEMPLTRYSVRFMVSSDCVSQVLLPVLNPSAPAGWGGWPAARCR